MDLNFRSDNEAPVAGPIMEAIVAANEGTAASYAEDEWSLRLEDAFSALFETPCRVLPVATGTIANSIALAAVTPPWGSVICHQAAHIYTDESGAPELVGGGLRLVPLDGADGKLQPDGLRAGLRRCEGHGVHSVVPAAISLTEATESGTVYRPEEVAELARIAHEQALVVHMDGARFANAVAALDVHPAEVTWRAGVDALSFGASKNGCMAAEALVLFNDRVPYDLAERHRKRTGHLLSKMRYVSAQLLAYLADDTWLRLAGRANGHAARVAAAVDAHPEATLEYPVEANELFLRWNATGFARLEKAGIGFHYWPGRDDLARLVFSPAHEDEEIERLLQALGG